MFPQAVPVETIKPLVFLDVLDPSTTVAKSVCGVVPAKIHVILMSLLWTLITMVQLSRASSPNSNLLLQAQCFILYMLPRPLTFGACLIFIVSVGCQSVLDNYIVDSMVMWEGNWCTILSIQDGISDGRNEALKLGNPSCSIPVCYMHMDKLTLL